MESEIIDSSIGFLGTPRKLYRSLISRAGMRRKAALSLDDRIRELTSIKEKIKITEDKIDNFCSVVKEINPFHTNAEFAKEHSYRDMSGRKHRYKDRFAPGTQLAAFGEQFVDGLIDGINKYVDKPYILTHFNINFGTHPVYPGIKYHPVSLLWLFYGFSWDDDDSLTLNIVGGDSKRLKKVKLENLTKRDIKRLGISIDVKLGHAPYPKEDLHLYGADCSRTYDLVLDDVKLFYESIGESPERYNDRGVPWMCPASLITSTLLDLSKELTGRISGMHIGTDFEFYKEPVPGDLSVELFVKKDNLKDFKQGIEKQKKSHYRIDAVCSQEHSPILYGKATVLSEKGLHRFNTA